MTLRARTRTLALDDYPNGKRQLGPVTLQPQDRVLVIELARCTSASPATWPLASTKVLVGAEVSYDGGVTWEFGGSCDMLGGTQHDRAGQEVPTAVFFTTLRPGDNRQIRLNLEVTGGPIRTECFAALHA